jgi:LPXTG-motif cell wall-anchored protein
MADATIALDTSTRAALLKLADIALPAPISWMPQTWGWMALAGLLLAAGGWLMLRKIRRYAANRYRREALGELARLELRLADDRERGEALAALPELLKRVALTAWQRTEVATLSGQAWVVFLRKHAGPEGFPDLAANLIDDLEYRTRRPTLNAEEGLAVAKAVRKWIEGHVVSA